MSAPSDAALGGSPTETPLITEDRVKAIAVEIANDEDLNTVEIMNLCFDYLASQRALRAAREQNAADTARLDAMERYSIAVSEASGYMEGVADVEMYQHDEDGQYLDNPEPHFTVTGPKTRFGNRNGEGKTLREAADRAMAWEHAVNLNEIEEYSPRAVASSSQETPNG